MNRFLLSEPAERDLQLIAEYLAEQSPALVQRYRSKFLARFELLARFPLQSAVDPRLDGDVRMALVKPYQVFYRPSDRGVEILRVIHSSRDLHRALEDQGS